MKTVLVLTDFSEKAAHAAKAAAMLSEKLGANILMLKANVLVPITSYYDGGFAVRDDYVQIEAANKQQFEKLANELKPLIGIPGNKGHKPDISYQNVDGDLAESVLNVIEQKDVEMIVMGGRCTSTIEHFLMGSDTTSVINKVTRPVLIVPERHELTGIKKVTFATDFRGEDMHAVDYLIKLGKRFDFEIEIAHVSPLGDEEPEKSVESIAFMQHVTRQKYPHVTYKSVKAKDAIKRLNKLCHESRSDLLVMVHYQHSFLMRMLLPSDTRKELSNQKIPLLVIPSKMWE